MEFSPSQLVKYEEINWLMDREKYRFTWMYAGKIMMAGFFYGISTLVGYLVPNPVYTYKYYIYHSLSLSLYIYIYIFDKNTRIKKTWRSPVNFFFVFLEISKMRNRIEINL